MVCIMVSGCSREDFSVQRVDAFPTIIVTYALDGSLAIGEGLSVAVLPSSRGISDYFITIVPPNQHFRWESQAVAFDVGGVGYLGVPDLVLPAGFPLPEGTWGLELLHADGRVIEHGFQINRNAQHRAIITQPELWIPRFFWEESADKKLIPTIGIPSDSSEQRSLQETWNIQFLDAYGTILHSLRAKEGPLALTGVLLQEIGRNAVRVVTSRYDDSSGCLLIGQSFL